MSVKEFAADLRTSLAGCLAPAEVSFLGSFARGDFDEFSDVDLAADVQAPMDRQFFAALEKSLTGRHGPALIRYDPDFRADTAAQGIRISFHRMPIFWRVDLTVRSSVASTGKWPSPFPEWEAGTSALMNVVWAIKGHRRRSAAAADHYLGAASGKLGLPLLPYSDAAVQAILLRLRGRTDADPWLLDRVAEAAEAARGEMP